MPTFTTPFVQTVVGGYFGPAPGVDIWRTGFKIPLTDGTVPDTEDLNQFLETIKPFLSTWHAGSDLNAGSQVWMKTLTAAVVGTDGKYLGGGLQETTRNDFAAALPGGGSNIHNLASALCISFATPRARGRASRGRMFWPCRGITLGVNDGMLSTSLQTTIAAAAKTLIDGINGAANPLIGAASVISVMSGLGTGTTAPVTDVSIGRKMDHQERREGELSEGHVWVDLSSTALLKTRARADLRDSMQEEVG